VYRTATDLELVDLDELLGEVGVVEACILTLAQSQHLIDETLREAVCRTPPRIAVNHHLDLVT
jgi:hypothetical protein